MLDPLTDRPLADAHARATPPAPVGHHGRRLLLTATLARPRLTAVTAKLWDHPRLRQLLPEYLFDLYSSMRATVPLMELALERARALADTCPVAAALVPYFARHIEEEMHHDEWMLEDMERLGIPAASTRARLPRPAVAALMGSQYFWVRHVHPVAFLGYTAVVEGTPVTSELVDRIVIRTGYPTEAFRTLYKHAFLDALHGADIWRLLDDLPLAPSHVALLGVSAVTTVDRLADVIAGVIAEPHGSARPPVVS